MRCQKPAYSHLTELRRIASSSERAQQQRATAATRGRLLSTSLRLRFVKEGPSFDLPIALATLQLNEQNRIPEMDHCYICGELAVSGELRRARGTLAVAPEARKRRRERLIVPHQNAAEAATSSQEKSFYHSAEQKGFILYTGNGSHIGRRRAQENEEALTVEAAKLEDMPFFSCERICDCVSWIIGCTSGFDWADIFHQAEEKGFAFLNRDTGDPYGVNNTPPSESKQQAAA
jgi:Subunit ChlI of Mg-chelatase